MTKRIGAEPFIQTFSQKVIYYHTKREYCGKNCLHVRVCVCCFMSKNYVHHVLKSCQNILRRSWHDNKIACYMFRVTKGHMMKKTVFLFGQVWLHKNTSSPSKRRKVYFIKWRNGMERMRRKITWLHFLTCTQILFYLKKN